MISNHGYITQLTCCIWPDRVHTREGWKVHRLTMMQWPNLNKCSLFFNIISPVVHTLLPWVLWHLDFHELSSWSSKKYSTADMTSLLDTSSQRSVFACYRRCIAWRFPKCICDPSLVTIGLTIAKLCTFTFVTDAGQRQTDGRHLDPLVATPPLVGETKSGKANQLLTSYSSFIHH